MTSTNRKKNKTHPRDIAFLILLGFISTSILLAYFFVSNYYINQLSNSPEIDFKAWSLPMNNYKNATANYSFLYPASWQAQSSTQSEEVLLGKTDAEENVNLQIKLHPQEGLSLFDWLQKLTKENGNLMLIEDKQIIVGNIPGMFLRLNEKEDASKQSMVVFVPYNNYIYEIKLTYPAKTNLNRTRKIFNKIISTFAF